MHLNHETVLPPVGCPLMILVDDKLVRAHRPNYVRHKNSEMTYVLECGKEIVGKFKWTYP